MKNTKNKDSNIINSFLLFFIGGFIYYFLEIMFRGHSHYSMFFAGGLSIVSIDLICHKIKYFKNKNIFLKAFLSGTIITIIEFIIGLIFNIFLEQNVWDYTSLPLNLYGQICLPFSFLWILLSFPAIYICKIFNKNIFSFLTKKKKVDK